MTRRLLIPLSILTVGALIASGAYAAAIDPVGFAPLDPDGSCQQDTTVHSSAMLRAPRGLRVTSKIDAGRQHTDQGVTIDEPIFDVRAPLHPGDSFACMLTIRNRTSHSTTYDITPLGLLGSRTDQVRLVGQDDADINATAANWVDPLVGSITMKAEEVATIPLVITVPPDPPKGGVFASIQVVARQPASATASQPQVGVTSGAAATLFTRVGGVGNAKLSFQDTRTHVLRTNRATWMWRARLDNDGTIQALPNGRLRVRSIFGSTVAHFDIHARPLLPKGGTPIQVTWNGTPWFGIYRWDAKVDSTGDTHATSATASGWIVALPPWWLVALILLLAAAVVAWPVVRRRREWRNYLDEDSAAEDETELE